MRAPVFLSMRNDREAKTVTFASERPVVAEAGGGRKAVSQRLKPSGRRTVSGEAEAPSDENGKAMSKWAHMRASANGRKASKAKSAGISAAGAEIARQIREAAKADLTLEIDGKKRAFNASG